LQGPSRALRHCRSQPPRHFTDFAISKPWLFQALAYTRTQRKLLYPDNGERYPSAARIVNMKTGGELILIPASLARTPTGLAVMKRLQIDFESMPKL
jgi:hypothetical protein